MAKEPQAAMTAEQLDAEIEREQAPAKRRGLRVKELAAKKLAGELNDDESAEFEKLKAEKHTRSPRLQQLLATRAKAQTEERKRFDAQVAAEFQDPSALSDAEVLSMHAQLKLDVRARIAQMRVCADEMVRRQSRSNMKAKADKMSDEEGRAMYEELKAKFGK